MPLKITSIIFALLFVLTGCEGEAHLHAAPEHPELQGFYVVDSDGVSSEYASDQALTIDPYINGGLFEVYWYAYSFYDYYVYLSINDRPGLDGARYILSDRCGIDLICDTDGWYLCEYTTDFYLGCGLDLNEADRNLVDIYDLFVQVPDTLYLNLEVCDTDDRFCQVQSVPVRMY